MARNVQPPVPEGHRNAVVELLARAGGNTVNAERAVDQILPMDAACVSDMVASSGAEEPTLPPDK